MGEVLTLEPKDGISVPNPEYDSDTGKTSSGDEAKPTKFVLFTEDWIGLQNFVAGALRLPISQGDFVEKYGDLKKKKLITDAVDAFKDLHDSAQEFGNPAALRAEWAAQKVPTKQPKALYGKIVWLAGQIATKAETFMYTYDSLKDVLDPKLPEEELKANLKEILTGPGGLRSEAEEMVTLCTALRGDLANFGNRIEKNREKINAYFNQKAEIYTAVEGALQDVIDKITDLEKERDSLERDFQAAAGGAAGGAALIMIFSAGLAWPLALGVGLGVGLGVAEKARIAMENTKDLIKERETDKQKKIALKLDIDGLNKQIGDIKDKVDSVAKGLAEITMVWDDQIRVLDQIVKSTDFEKTDYSTLNKKIKISYATKSWKQIAKDTIEFRHTSLVDFRTEARQAA